MPGLFNYISKSDSKLHLDSTKKILRSHPDISFNDIKIDDYSVLFTFGNLNYPYYSWTYSGFIVVIIGMIYNVSKKIIISKVETIIDKFNNNKDSEFHSDINDLVDSLDGDYVIYAHSKEKEKGFLFNDILGRLPIYYYSDGKHLSICSEQKGVLHAIPEISINRFELVNMLVFSHTLGDTTLFNGVKRLLASRILTYDRSLLINEIEGPSMLRIRQRQKVKRSDAIKKLASLINVSIKNRVDTLKKDKYKIIADLTGGFDSRIVLGALSKQDKDVNYYTFEYIHDESIIAKELFEKLDSPGIYTKLSFENKIEDEKISEIVYKTDGLVNYYSSYICYNDLEFLYTKVPNKKTARFGGLGGEFFRHPYKVFHKNIYDGVEKGLYNGSINAALDIVKIDPVLYRKKLRKFFSNHYSYSKEVNLKYFYLQAYYRIHVCLNAEDRERIHFWSVHPLYNKDIVSFFVNEFPLKWANYNFFTDLMKEIDPCLLDVAIYNRKIQLKSKISRVKYDFFNEFNSKYKKELLLLLTNNMKVTYELYKKVKSGLRHKHKQKVSKTTIAYQSLNFNLKTLNSNFNKYFKSSNSNSIILKTILIYFDELENRYSEKIN